jgi:hypothetical protein
MPGCNTREENAAEAASDEARRQRAEPFARVELGLTENAGANGRPDYAHLRISADLVALVARARAMLSLDLLGVVPEIVLSLPDVGTFFEDCGDEPDPEYEPADGDFVVSSGWLTVGTNSLCVAYWDEYSDDELRGFVDDAALNTAVDRAVPIALRQVAAAINARLQAG